MSKLPNDEQLSTLADLEAFLKMYPLRVTIVSKSGTDKKTVYIDKLFGFEQYEAVAEAEDDDLVVALRVVCAEAMKEIAQVDLLDPSDEGIDKATEKIIEVNELSPDRADKLRKTAEKVKAQVKGLSQIKSLGKF